MPFSIRLRYLYLILVNGTLCTFWLLEPSRVVADIEHCHGGNHLSNCKLVVYSAHRFNKREFVQGTLMNACTFAKIRVTHRTTFVL